MQVGDIDIDILNRDLLLNKIKHIPASMSKEKQITKHPTGIYVQDIPVDTTTGYAAITYEDAEKHGFVKIDFLNSSLYEGVRNEQHLISLMNEEPDWNMLLDKNISKSLYQVHSHQDILEILKPSSVEELAMAIAIIRPGKRYLLNSGWNEIRKRVWIKEDKNSYSYKKSHATSYAMAIVVQMNLIREQTRRNNING